MGNNHTQITFRLSKKMLAEIDAYAYDRAREDANRQTAVYLLLESYLSNPNFTNSTHFIDLRMPRTEIVNVQLPNSIVSEIRKIAESENTTMSAVIRYAVYRELHSRE